MKYKYTKTFSFDGKRYYVRGQTMKEVYEKMANKKRDLLENKVTLDSNITVSDWAYTAVNTYKTNQADITRKKYVNRMDHCILSHIGHMRIKDVKPIKCQEILNLQSGFSKRHINEVAQIMYFIFDSAKKNHLILENPAEDLTRPEGKASQSRSMYDKERKSFTYVVDNNNEFLLFELMLYCGCRPSEAMECKGGDITILNGVHCLHIRGTKTRNADRLVPIPDHLYEKIKDCAHEDYIASHNGRKHDRTSYRRLTHRLYREMDVSLGAKLYRNQIVESKLAEDFRPYVLRHTYCTDLARKGIDVRVAQKLMGHADITTTANIYTHVDHSFISDIAFDLGATPVQQ